MDQVTYTKSAFRAQQWAEIIQACQSSGQTVVIWCAQHDVSIKSYYWLRKLRLRAMEEGHLPVVTSGKPVTFQKVEVQTSLPDRQAAVIIHLRLIIYL